MKTSNVGPNKNIGGNAVKSLYMKIKLMELKQKLFPRDQQARQATTTATAAFNQAYLALKEMGVPKGSIYAAFNLFLRQVILEQDFYSYYLTLDLLIKLSNGKGGFKEFGSTIENLLTKTNGATNKYSYASELSTLSSIPETIYTADALRSVLKNLVSSKSFQLYQLFLQFSASLTNSNLNLDNKVYQNFKSYLDAIQGADNWINALYSYANGSPDPKSPFNQILTEAIPISEVIQVLSTATQSNPSETTTVSTIVSSGSTSGSTVDPKLATFGTRTRRTTTFQSRFYCKYPPTNVPSAN